MPIVIASRGDIISLGSLQNFNQRSQADIIAISKLKKLFNANKIDEKIVITFKEAKKADAKIKDTRDIFAHGKTVTQDESIKSKSEEIIRPRIERMFEKLEEVIKIEKDDWNNIYSLLKK